MVTQLPFPVGGVRSGPLGGNGGNSGNNGSEIPGGVPSGDVAVADLGSNSFHLVVARTLDSRPVIVDRIREAVQLAAGLDDADRLSEEAQTRALACLQRFGQRLRGLPPERVRVVGTNTFRRAQNGRTFLEVASQVLGHPIEIVSGREEARLIYMGVAHDLPLDDTKRLVVDIGGGSTEIIVGLRDETLLTESLDMGCVTYTIKFFLGGRVTRDAFKKAEMAALSELQTVEQPLSAVGWDVALGSSGTLLAVVEAARANGFSVDGVDLEALRKLRRAMIDVGEAAKLSQIPGIRPERAAMLPGGVAILYAIFKSLRLERMRGASGAMREGLLYDLVGRIRHEDVRARAVERMAERFGADAAQSARVADAALYLLRRVAGVWEVAEEEAGQILAWAARLHEIGLAVAHSGYHKHGAYVVRYADLPGFSRDEQALLAVLVLAHRRKLTAAPFRELSPPRDIFAQRLALLLRISVLLRRNRAPEPLPDIVVVPFKRGLELVFPKGWLEAHPLTRADLEGEAEEWRQLGFKLALR